MNRFAICQAFQQLRRAGKPEQLRRGNKIEGTEMTYVQFYKEKP